MAMGSVTGIVPSASFFELKEQRALLSAVLRLDLSFSSLWLKVSLSLFVTLSLQWIVRFFFFSKELI